MAGRPFRIVATLVVLPCLVAAFVWLAYVPPRPLAVVSRGVVLSGVTVINPGMDRLADRTIAAGGGSIESIAKTVEAEREGTAAEFAGAFVVPGLSDVHVHLPPAQSMLTPYMSLLYLLHGVTTVREAGDADGTAVEAARAGRARDEFPAPRVLACGPFVDGQAGRWANTRVVATPAEADAAVDAIAAAGFDCVKVYDHLSRESLAAIQEAAVRVGLPVIGHVPLVLAFEDALLDDAQHFTGVPDPRNLFGNSVRARNEAWATVGDRRLDEVVRVAAERGIASTPTLASHVQLLRVEDYEQAVLDPETLLMPRVFRDVVWHPREGLPFIRDLRKEDFAALRRRIAKMKILVRRLHEAGAPLHMGTDVQLPFVVPGASLHRELRLFVDAGLTPEQAWEIATRGNAKVLGVPGLGVLRAGAPADFLVFAEDPTDDIDSLSSLRAVVADGRLYRREELDGALAEYQDHFGGFFYDRLSVMAGRALLRRAVDD